MGLSLESGHWPPTREEIVLGHRLFQKWRHTSHLIWHDQYHRISGALQWWQPLPWFTFDLNQCIVQSFQPEQRTADGAIVPLHQLKQFLNLLEEHSPETHIHFKTTEEWIAESQQKSKQLAHQFEWIPYLIGCLSGLNLIQTQLTQMHQRQYEWAVRLICGAPMHHLSIQCFLESFFTCFCSAFMGIGIGTLLIHGYTYHAHIDTSVPFHLLQNFGHHILLGIVLSLIPAWQIQRWNILSILQQR